MKNLLTHFSKIRGYFSASQGNDVGYDCRLTVVRPSFDRRSSMLKLCSILAILLTVGVGNAWGTTYTFNSSIPTTSWSTSGGSQTINSISWTYSSSTYIGATAARIQIGSKNNPQTSNWTIQTAISNFGSGKKVTAVAITGYATENASYSSYDISVGGSSVKSGSFSTSSDTYTASSLNVTSGNIVITLCGNGTKNTKALYLSNISVTYEDASADPYTVSFETGTGNPTQANITEASGGAGITLPAGPTPTCSGDGWSFAGWKETSAVTSETTVAPTLLSAGNTFHPTGNVTLYAVYAKEGYAREKSSITSGSKYLIVANYDSKNYVMTDSYSLDGDSEGHMDSEQVDEDEDDFYLASSIDSDWRYSIEGTPSHYDIRDVKNSSSANYLDIAYKNWYGKGDDNTDEWIITVSSGNWTLQNEYYSNYLAFNTTNKVFERRSGTVWLYKQVTVYFSNPTCCTPLGSINGSFL